MSRKPVGRPSRERATAAAWGFAEATLFFFVPDVFLSAVALRDATAALRACLWSTVGAVAGGALMYLWGSRDPAGVAAALDAVPAIAPATVTRVRAALEASGFIALFPGAFSGIPYKLYAAEAGALGMGLAGFLAVTVPARLVRFALVSLLASGLGRLRPLQGWSPAGRLRAHALAWAAFYAVYWSLMPW